jgi:hypothetical protein
LLRRSSLSVTNTKISAAFREPVRLRRRSCSAAMVTRRLRTVKKIAGLVIFAKHFFFAARGWRMNVPLHSWSTSALTNDHHFEQDGFVALLKSCD